MQLDSYPLESLLIKRKHLRRELLQAPGLRDVRIAVLVGSTTNEVIDLVELLLLSAGFRPTILQSEYNRFYEDAVLTPGSLVAFQPDIVYLHTSCMNVQHFPPLQASEPVFRSCIEQEMSRFCAIWNSLESVLGCQIIQNNFDGPPFGLMGNLDATAYGGQTHFLAQLNAEFAAEARRRPRLLIQDIHSISARIGLERWFDWERWFSYKVLTTPEANLLIARSLLSLVRAIYGMSRKCLVLDLDNTLWGGVIGDDGPDRIQIGRETPIAESYTAFQEYCLSLRNRGILLAVCSKNDPALARQGFEVPDSVLKLEHFAAFKANWEPKHENLLAIAAELNLGIDSFVFVDDNPAERAIVAAQLPVVAVPDVGTQVSHFPAIIEAERYFETVSLSAEDLQRNEQYAANSQRAQAAMQFASYGDYLDSLEMVAEVDAFQPVYLDRIAQLTNKTNQFNLTTRRYTLPEIERIASDEGYVTLYGKLTDRFGDNGLISVVIGRQRGTALHIDLWLMSCRVLKRQMEVAMLDKLVEAARAASLLEIYGYYIPTKKNALVAEHYSNLGFTPVSVDPATQSSTWKLDVATYIPGSAHIQFKEILSGQPA